jgi:hypothetical protein
MFSRSTIINCRIASSHYKRQFVQLLTFDLLHQVMNSRQPIQTNKKDGSDLTQKNSQTTH